jgi:hypothetical protein
LTPAGSGFLIVTSKLMVTVPLVIVPAFTPTAVSPAAFPESTVP